ncbi:MAG: YraN family protein [Acidobacteriota bacterium]
MGILSLWPRLLRALRGPSDRSREGTAREGENLAGRYLESHGYRILARNYRVRGGEADLLVEKGGWLIVVEVKTRRSRRFGSALEAVTPTKARRVLLAGRVFARRQGISLTRLRGDVVALDYPDGGGEPRLTHIQDALPFDRGG